MKISKKRVIIIILILALITASIFAVFKSNIKNNILNGSKEEVGLIDENNIFNVMWKKEQFSIEMPKFISWLSEKGYSERVIEIYKEDAKDPDLKRMLLVFFKMRNKDPSLSFLWNDLKGSRIFKLNNPIQIVFHELIPEDEFARYCVFGEEKIPLFEKYLVERFGKQFIITYKPLTLNFSERFGERFFERNEFSRSKEFRQFIEEEGLFKENNEYHIFLIGVERLNKNIVPLYADSLEPDMAGAGIVIGRIAELPHCWDKLTPIELTAKFDLFGEEMGHSFGMSHEYYEGELRNSVIKGLTLSGVMGHTDELINESGVWVSPLMRYALEPYEGYDDDPAKTKPEPGFGEVYNTVMDWRINKNG